MSVAAVTPAAALTPPRRDARPAVPDLPKAPNPVTPASAAVHIMRVPSSRLLEGFASLQQAASAQAPPAKPPAASKPPAAPRPAARLELDKHIVTAATPGSVVDLEA